MKDNVPLELLRRLISNRPVGPKLNTAARARIQSAPQQIRTTNPSSRQQQQRTKSEASVLSIKGIESKYLSAISDEILDSKPSVSWDDVIGQQNAKEALREMVILPALNPELFVGLREPAKSLLLFGPPGNGKTLLAKAVAAEGKAKFFNISASALTSKWFGEGEKLVRALFAVANHVQPSVIFIDEVDSLLGKRQDSQNDAMKRLVAEFLVQSDGVATQKGSRVILMGATNLPEQLDEAALRRFAKRVYVGLPASDDRLKLLSVLLEKHYTEQAK
ncbi:unnamed protein product, partial [Notodromas monacha]